MSEQNDSPHRPGEPVPVSGIYECDCAKTHRISTDVKGHPFPPLPEECSGSVWRLKTPAHPQ